MSGTDHLHQSHATEQLRAYVSRLERIEGEIDGLNDGKRDIYNEAKAAGFCKKTLRKVIMRRRRSAQEVNEEDEMLELYEAALAGHVTKHGDSEDDDDSWLDGGEVVNG